MAKDTDFANVSALFHFEGDANDASTNALVGTLNGAGATLITSGALHGTGSLDIADTSSYLSVTGSRSLVNFGTDNLTVEYTVKVPFALTTGVQVAHLSTYAAASGGGWHAGFQSNGSGFDLFFSDGNTADHTPTHSASWFSLAPGEQYDIAFSGNSASGLKCFADGIYLGTTGSWPSLPSGADIRVNGLAGGASKHGVFVLDEVRITKGVSRYSTAGYTPSLPFPTDKDLVLSGSVRDATNALAARKVAAYREDTNALVGTTTSDATTGTYSIEASADTAHTLVFYPALGENLNALVRRGVLPIET